MKEFYVDILGWDYDTYNLDYKHLSFKIGTVYLVIMESKNAEKMEGWAQGPVFQEGKSKAISFSVKVNTEDDYRKIVKKLQNTTEAYWENPKLVSNYWSFIVKDPMGLTLDVFYQPSEHPENPNWS